MQNEVITLVGKGSVVVDDYGDKSYTETEKVVFAEVKSIGQSEFYQAQTAGLKPEIKFVIADYLDYSGEKVVRYTAYGSTTEEEYTVLRTYRSKNSLEIVCKRGVDV